MGPRIVVFGDIMLDRRIEGKMERVSLEAPAPVIALQRVAESLGGAGNVARNITGLGEPVLLAGVIGNDEAGDVVRKLAVEESVGLYGAVGKQTITKTRVTCGGQIICRIDDEKPCVSADDAMLEAVASLESFAGTLRLIVIADYDKGAMTAVVRNAIAAFAAKHGLPVYVDARPSRVASYAGATLLKPNMAEALQLVGDSLHIGLESQADRAMVAASLVRRKYGFGTVLVTDGANGCAYTDPDAGGDIESLNAWGGNKVDHVRDICGAGDTVMAAMAVGAVQGKSFSESAKYAMQAAGYVVQYYGVHRATVDEVAEFIHAESSWPAKIVDIQGVRTFIARRRKRDPHTSVVLTNGCFDGFHAGHLELLRYAKTCGDVLVVAYNSDESLRAVKGAGRPHVPDSYRASHLALQSPVDLVVRFDGDVGQLVKEIDPDVLVKGADTPQPIQGADYVVSRGGRVAMCPLDKFCIVIDRDRSQVGK